VSVDLARLPDLIEAFPRRTITVLGDFVADAYVFGEIARVSREAPVLILRHRERRLLPGGGANAANNLADLGARVLPASAVGDDEAGRALVEYFRGKGVDTSGLLRLRGRHTTTKTRFLAGWTHTTAQQVLRVDRESPLGDWTEKDQRLLFRRALERAAESDAVLLSDYGLGCVTPAVAARLRREVRRTCITLDSRFALLSFAGCGVTAATPNEPELEALFGARIGADARRLEHFGARTLRRMKMAALLVTRGKDGMALFQPRARPLHIPVFGSDEAKDVTGAGDTVIAVFTLALAAGASFAEAAHLANFAGGIVVMKRGTATVTRAELLDAVRSAATR
jgi:rfaE bifunctional protein kinase chain/domain